MRRLGQGLGALLAALGFLWLLVPLEGVGRPPFLNPAFDLALDPARIGPDPQTYLAEVEAQVPGITPGTQKRILWAGAPGVKTPLALIYLHGFSATSEEVRPVPDLVARALGANLFFTRLTGHGLTGDALAQATAADWLHDLDEALAIGRLIGQRTILIGTSTGGTLAAFAAANPPPELAGVVLISPNFRLAPLAARLLDLPLVRQWGPLLVGQQQTFAPRNAAHARYWTNSYPTRALFPLAALMRAARSLDFPSLRTPALFLYSPADQVVSPTETARIAARWGGPATMALRTMAPGDDPYSHVIAGDILSPGQTAETSAIITEWAKTLPEN